MKERTYKLLELGITEEAARDLMAGRAVVVPAPKHVHLRMIAAATVIEDPGTREWPLVATCAYEQMVTATPYGMANVEPDTKH